MSAASPVASRAFDGPSSGRTRYGPDGTPQTPSVVPNPCEFFGSPIFSATSYTPRKPTVELITNRDRSMPAFLKFSCNRSFTTVSGVFKLPRKVRTFSLKPSVVTARYPFTTGRRAYLSACMLNAKILRFIGSSGSFASRYAFSASGSVGAVAQPAVSKISIKLMTAVTFFIAADYPRPPDRTSFFRGLAAFYLL